MILDSFSQMNNFKVQQKLDVLNSVRCSSQALTSRVAECVLLNKLCLSLQVFSYFHAQYTFFHQGFDLLKDLEPTMKTMASQVIQNTYMPYLHVDMLYLHSNMCDTVMVNKCCSK